MVQDLGLYHCIITAQNQSEKTRILSTRTDSPYVDLDKRN